MYIVTFENVIFKKFTVLLLGKPFPAKWGLRTAFALAKVMQMVGPKILLGFHSFMDFPLYMGLASPLL